jgi:hypothetical protein
MVARQAAASTGLCHGLAFEPSARIGKDGGAGTAAFDPQTVKGILTRSGGASKPG